LDEVPPKIVCIIGMSRLPLKPSKNPSARDQLNAMKNPWPKQSSSGEVASVLNDLRSATFLAAQFAQARNDRAESWMMIVALM
jgi:hypothetical protein